MNPEELITLVGELRESEDLSERSLKAESLIVKIQEGAAALTLSQGEIEALKDEKAKLIANNHELFLRVSGKEPIIEDPANTALGEDYTIDDLFED